MLCSINVLCHRLAGHRTRGPHRVGSGRDGQRLRLGCAFFGAAVINRSAALFLLATLSTFAVADNRSELARARHDLAVSEQVLARVSAQVKTARLDPATGPQERARLDEYLARVAELVAQNRKRVQSLEESIEQTPAGLPVGGSAGGGETSRAATNAEEVAALDSKLGGSLSDFDRLLLEEARKARERAPSASSASEYGGSSGGGQAGGGGARQSQSKSTRTRQSSTGTDGDKPARSGSAGPGSPGGGGGIDGKDPGTPGATASVPPDVGDGNDDDIVARQIRKAAESETDPELRKKLWDEYRKYKQGSKS